MSAEAVATLYMKMDDDEDTRQALAGGDFTSFGDIDLDELERAIIRDAAAEELPDVVAFSYQVALPARHAAIDYVGKNIASPTAQASWLTFFDQRQLAHIAPGM